VSDLKKLRELAEVEAELARVVKLADLYQHMVLTCGVAATHPDPNLTRTGAYAAKWNSQQANEVRALRDKYETLRAVLSDIITERLIPDEYPLLMARAKAALGGGA
jgi:hypothetical protein